MAKINLFAPRDVWNIAELPEPWCKWAKTMNYEGDMVNPFHNGSPKVTLLRYVVEAIMAEAGLPVRSESPALVEFVNTDSEAWFGAECVDRKTGNTVIVDCKRQSTLNTMRCAVMDQSGVLHEPPAIPSTSSKESDIDLLPAYMAVIALFRAISTDFDAECEVAKRAVLAGNRADDREKLSLYRVSDMLYFGVLNNALELKMPGGNFEAIKPAALSGGLFSGGRVIYGTSKVFCNESVTTQKVTTFGEAKKQFAAWANSRKWTDEEEALIPSFPDDYPIMEEAVEIAKWFISTHNDRRPMVNFLWRGITSYGKSTGVEMLAAFLHTPLLRMTCNSTMETQDFLSTFVPDNGNCDVEALPHVTVEEMFCDPESAYFKITGRHNPNATDQDCLSEMMERSAALSRNGQARFKHVESNFVIAMSRGYICEIQEASRIKDPGVLVGLNEYDRPGSNIRLVDGGYTTRHPDALCIYTDNVGYASCRPMDPSVIRRFSMIFDSTTLTEKQVLSRVIYNTGFAMEKKVILKQMYYVWKEIQTYCEEHEIDEGSVSVTELEMWAATVKGDGYGNLYKNAIRTVISKATSVPEEQKELINMVLTPNIKEGT